MKIIFVIILFLFAFKFIIFVLAHGSQYCYFFVLVVVHKNITGEPAFFIAVCVLLLLTNRAIKCIL